MSRPGVKEMCTKYFEHSNILPGVVKSSQKQIMFCWLNVDLIPFISKVPYDPTQKLYIEARHCIVHVLE